MSRKSTNCGFISTAPRFSNAVAFLDLTRPPRFSMPAAPTFYVSAAPKAFWVYPKPVIFFDLELAEEFDYRCKQAGQLASKTRISSAPWAAMLNENHWLHYARVANAAAQTLAAAFGELGLPPLYPVQANAVFIKLPPAVAAALRAKGWHFYDFDGAARFMCSWNADERAIRAFIEDLKQVLPGERVISPMA